jgi:D-aminoacyl-tRNA deacylase
MLQDISTFLNGRVRLLKQDRSIVEEDNLDKRWEELTGEIVDEIIFLSKHIAASNRPALTVHPIGRQHLVFYYLYL